MTKQNQTKQQDEFRRILAAMDAADGKQDCVIHKGAALHFLKVEELRLISEFSKNLAADKNFGPGKPAWDAHHISFGAVLKLQAEYGKPEAPAVQQIPNCKASAAAKDRA